MNGTLKSITFAIGFTLLGAGLGTAAGAFANGGHGGPESREGGRGGHEGGPSFGGHLYRLYSSIDLTETQQAQLDGIRDHAREEVEQDREERRQDAGQMVELLSQAKPDRKAIHKKIDERIAEKGELIHDTIDEVLDLHESLSDAQRQELVDNMRQHMERRGDD